MEVLFFDTLTHESSEELNMDLVRFSMPVCIQEIRVIPRGCAMHPSFRDESHLGKTSPHTFKLEAFVHKMRDSSAVFERLGTLEYKEGSDIQLLPKTQVATESIVVRGRYSRLTIMVLGVLASRGKEPERSPSPPPPPPPPPKQVPQPSKRPIETVITPEPIQPHSTIDPIPADWETQTWTHEQDAKRARYIEPEPEPILEQPITTVPQPLPKKGPRTPSPPHPAGGEPWEQPAQGDERAAHVWQGGAAEGRTEWQTTDSWEGQAEGTTPAPEHADAGEGWENWKTTDSWEPGWGDENEEDWDDERVERSHRGPRTPPGEPELQSPDDREKGDGGGSEVEEEDEEGREDKVELFEPLSPEDTSSQRRRYSSQDPDALIEVERQRSADNDDTDSVGQGYEDILSDEEALEDVDSLRGLLEAGVDLEGLEDDSWPEIPTFDLFQHELLPLKTFNDPDVTACERQLAICEESKPCDLPKEAQAIMDMVVDYGQGDLGAKWVSALEELLSLLDSGLALAGPGCLTTIVHWTLQALDYERAQKQVIVVNIRQIKAGMRLAAGLCDLGPTLAKKLLDAGVQESLLKLLFTDHMASSIKLLAIRALDCTTNWWLGIERFLGVSESPAAPSEGLSGYQQMVSFLLTEQSVRVVTAAASLINKLHLYEVLNSLKELTESIADRVPAPETDLDPGAYQASEEGVEDLKGEAKPPGPGDGGGDETIDTVESSSLEEERMDGDPTAISSGDMGRLVGCLTELLTSIKTASHAMVQPSVKPPVFPTSVTINCPPAANPWPVMCRMFRRRNLLESLLLLLSCPATSSNVEMGIVITDVVLQLLDNWSGLQYMFTELETCKALFQSLTSNYDDEESTECETNLYQLGLRLMYGLCAVQYVDLIRQHPTTSNDLLTRVENEGVLGALSGAYMMAGSSLGAKLALARVFGMGDNLECLLPLAHLMETRDTGDEKVILASKKTAIYGYAAQLLTIVVQYSEDVSFLYKHVGALLESGTEEHVVRKWVQPLKGIKLDSTCIAPILESIGHSMGQLTTNLGGLAPGVLTGLRILQHVVCPGQHTQGTGQQKDLKYKVATMQLYSSGAQNTFSTCLKKVSDFMLRPWQQGMSLSSGHTHILESITLCVLRLLRTMLTQLLEIKDTQFFDDRLVSNLLLVHTVICSAPSSGILSDVAVKVQAGVVDILLSFTQPMADLRDRTEADIANSCWTKMLHAFLEYIPSAPYTYMGGLQLFAELLPLPLPMQTQENLSEAEVQQALNLRRLWSVHLHTETPAIQRLLRELSLSSSPLLQHFLRRFSCQLADLASPMALLVVRSHLDAFLSCLEPREEGSLKEQPCNADASRVLTLLVYLISQPAIKAAFLHLARSSVRSDERYVDVLPRLLSLLNVPSQSSSHQQAQECIVTFLQSLCDPEITLLSSETLLMNEHLASSLPSRDPMEAVCGALLDHVTSPNHSYASILPALRMLTMLLDHNYGFFHLKSCLDQRPGAFHSLLARLTQAFSRESSDYLSTLSNTLDLLHLLLTREGDQQEAAPSMGEEGGAGGPGQGYRTLAMDVKELGDTLRWSEDENHPIRRLEKTLVDCCKHDETMEHLLDTVSSLLQALDRPPAAPLHNPPYSMLPDPMGLHDQFNARLVFYVTEDDDERLATSMWLGLPALDELDTEPEMVSCDLEDIRAKALPTFDLQSELAKGLGAEDVSPDKKKRGLNKRYNPLTFRSNKQIPSGIRRAHRGGYGRPDFGRGRGGYDVFRQRAQNTSRPPSMHVDDFMNAEMAHSDNQKPQRGPPGRSARGDFQRGGMRGGGGGGGGGGRGFHNNQGQWSGPNYRRDEGNQMGRGGRGRGQWVNRQQRAPFEGGPRGFNPRSRSESGPEQRLGPRDNQPYNRSGRGGHDRAYQPHASRGGSSGGGGSMRGSRGGGGGGGGGMSRGSFSPRRGGDGGGRGYRAGSSQGGERWGAPDSGSRFLTPKPMRGNRLVGSRETQGRHSRSFTR